MLQKGSEEGMVVPVSVDYTEVWITQKGGLHRRDASSCDDGFCRKSRSF